MGAPLLTPCALKPVYGYMWWLNTDAAMYPSAPATGFAAVGAGSNVVWVDPASDVVVVTRWIAKDAVDGLFGRVHAALRG